MVDMKWLFLLVVACVVVIQAEEECTDGEGIYLLGKTYDCSYLSTRQETNVGLYTHRRYYCNLPSTRCCATCKNICWGDGQGVYIAEKYEPCKYLTQYYPEDERIGIYKMNKFWCSQGTTDCCKSCEIVASQTTVSEETSSASMTTRKTLTTNSTRPSTQAPQPQQVVDTCDWRCIWMADGAMGTCGTILDASISYEERLTWCNGGFARGCDRSCQILRNQGKDVTSTKTPQTTSRPIVTGCNDNGYIYVRKNSYYCSELTTVNSDIYNDRKSICEQPEYRSTCCMACNKVAKEKPSGVIHYSDENTAIKLTSSQTNKQEQLNQVIVKVMENFKQQQNYFRILFARLFPMGRMNVRN